MFNFGRKKPVVDEPVAHENTEVGPPIDQKPFWDAVWPVLACGAGLFSDGYINNVIGSVSTTLGYEYGDVYTNSTAKQNVSAIAFAGTVSRSSRQSPASYRPFNLHCAHRIGCRSTDLRSSCGSLVANRLPPHVYRYPYRLHCSCGWLILAWRACWHVRHAHRMAFLRKST